MRELFVNQIFSFKINKTIIILNKIKEETILNMRREKIIRVIFRQKLFSFYMTHPKRVIQKIDSHLNLMHFNCEITIRI